METKQKRTMIYYNKRYHEFGTFKEYQQAYIQAHILIESKIATDFEIYREKGEWILWLHKK